MKKFSLQDVAALVIGVLPLGYLLWVYNSLPAIVPLHYGADGKPNGFGPKTELFLLQALLIGVSFLIYLLLKFLPSIDPKKQVKYGEKTFNKLGMGLVIFLAALNICVTFSTVNRSFNAGRLLLPMISLLFVFLGNMMNTIKPNYFAGVRTPWTLEDEGNWRATHRLAGKLWFIGGILLAIATLVLPLQTGTYIFIPCIVLMAFIPMIYSYIYFKKHQLK